MSGQPKNGSPPRVRPNESEKLAGRAVAQAIQLGIEYDPAPHLDAGDPLRAPAEIRDAVLARVRGRDAALKQQAG